MTQEQKKAVEALELLREKGFDIRDLILMIKLMGEIPEVGIKERICNLLLDIGASPENKGFKCLVEAINLAYNDPEVLHSFMDEIYPRVAEITNSTPGGVERVIRSEVKRIAVLGNQELLRKFFPENNLKCLTSSHFIATISMKLRSDNRKKD